MLQLIDFLVDGSADIGEESNAGLEVGDFAS